MPRKVETLVYKFDELSDEAKDKARDWWRTNALDYEWWDSTYESAVEAGKMLGIRIAPANHGGGPSIYFELDLGGGASFDGSYGYRKGGLEELREDRPAFVISDGKRVECEANAKMHEVGEALLEVQRKNFYKLQATIEAHGNTGIRVHVWHKDDQKVSEEAEEELREGLRDFAHWIYRALDGERDYIMANEQVDETILSNEYTFDEDGERVNGELASTDPVHRLLNKLSDIRTLLTESQEMGAAVQQCIDLIDDEIRKHEGLDGEIET